MTGFSATTEEVLRIWDGNAKNWQASGSPWRPSNDDIQLYQKLAGNKLRGKVLILGSTPELRDLASRYSAQPVLVDICSSMIIKMSTLLKEANPLNEVWVKSDWYEAPLSENSFDLALGDMPWWVVSVQGQEKLRDKIASILKPSGLLITRVRLRDPLRINEDGGKVIGRYLREFDQDHEKYHVAGNKMVSHLHDITADIAGKRISRTKTKELILAAAASAVIPLHKKFLIEFSERLLSADWTSQTRDEIMSVITRKFNIKNETHANDYDSEFYPIMAFVKK